MWVGEGGGVGEGWALVPVLLHFSVKCEGKKNVIKFAWKVMKAALCSTRGTCLLIFTFLASASGPHSIKVTYGKLFSLM